MKRPLVLVAVVLVVVLLAAALFAMWSDGRPRPEAAIPGAPASLGSAPATLELAVTAPSGRVAAVDVRLVQAGKERPLLAEDPVPDPAAGIRRSLVVDAGALGLEEGPAELHVRARDDAWRPRRDDAPRLVQSFVVDLTPPTIELRSSTRYIKHGGTGVVVWRARGASRTFVRCGSRDFPGTPGLSRDSETFVALFTVPWLDPPGEPVVHAVDEAGNARTLAVATVFLDVKVTRDEVVLREDFLRRKVPELNPKSTATETSALLADFIAINGDMRKENEARIREIAGSLQQANPLFAGAFRQQPGTKVFAGFPEERDYVHDGRTVDTQWHLGLDVASSRATPVLASNAGRVAFAGDNGIYGNMVVLDHGMGLATLYAHLSEIGVSVGQSVAQGESLGRSGMTGLAAGDHVHFAVLVHGTYTNPPDWFDARYIADRIAAPLLEAGIALPGLTDVKAPSPAEVRQQRKAERKRR